MRPETGLRVQSQCTDALALNALIVGLIAKIVKTLQCEAQNAKCRVRKLSAFVLTKEYLYPGVSHKGPLIGLELSAFG